MKLSNEHEEIKSLIKALNEQLKVFSDKMDALEDNALAHGRKMTEAEEMQWRKYSKMLNDISFCIDAFETVLDDIEENAE